MDQLWGLYWLVFWWRKKTKKNNIYKNRLVMPFLSNSVIKTSNIIKTCRYFFAICKNLKHFISKYSVRSNFYRPSIFWPNILHLFYLPNFQGHILLTFNKLSLPPLHSVELYIWGKSVWNHTSYFISIVYKLRCFFLQCPDLTYFIYIYIFLYIHHCTISQN